MKLIKVADVRSHLKSKGKRMARSFPLALALHVEAVIDKAVKAAHPAMTVKDEDLTAGNIVVGPSRRGL